MYAALGWLLRARAGVVCSGPRSGLARAGVRRACLAWPLVATFVVLAGCAPTGPKMSPQAMQRGESYVAENVETRQDAVMLLGDLIAKARVERAAFPLGRYIDLGAGNTTYASQYWCELHEDFHVSKSGLHFGRCHAYTLTGTRKVEFTHEGELRGKTFVAGEMSIPFAEPKLAAAFYETWNKLIAMSDGDGRSARSSADDDREPLSGEKRSGEYECNTRNCIHAQASLANLHATDASNKPADWPAAYRMGMRAMLNRVCSYHAYPPKKAFYLRNMAYLAIKDAEPHLSAERRSALRDKAEAFWADRSTCFSKDTPNGIPMEDVAPSQKDLEYGYGADFTEFERKLETAEELKAWGERNDI